MIRKIILVFHEQIVAEKAFFEEGKHSRQIWQFPCIGPEQSQADDHASDFVEKQAASLLKTDDLSLIILNQYIQKQKTPCRKIREAGEIPDTDKRTETKDIKQTERTEWIIARIINPEQLNLESLPSFKLFTLPEIYTLCFCREDKDFLSCIALFGYMKQRNGTQRLFLALPLPEKVKRTLIELQNAWKKEKIEGRYIPASSFHITLAFIGESNQADQIIPLLKDIQAPALELKTEGIGHFRNLYFANLADSFRLEQLALRLRNLLKQKDIPFDSKPFKAHITLLRNAKLPEDCRIEQNETSSKDSIFRIDRIILFESCRVKNQLIYVPVAIHFLDQESCPYLLQREL